MVLHEIANLGPPGLAGSIPAVGVELVLSEHHKKLVFQCGC